VTMKWQGKVEERSKLSEDVEDATINDRDLRLI
jgi:hypothetical protein